MINVGFAKAAGEANEVKGGTSGSRKAGWTGGSNEAGLPKGIIALALRVGGRPAYDDVVLKPDFDGLCRVPQKPGECHVLAAWGRVPGWMKMRRHYRTCTLPNSGPEDFAGMGKGGGRGPDCHVYFPEQAAFPIEAKGPKNLDFQARSKGCQVLGDLLGLLENR